MANALSFYKLANEISRRGGYVAAHQFQGSRLAEILDMACIVSHFSEGITVTRGRKTSGAPLLTILGKRPEGMAVGGDVLVDELRNKDLAEIAEGIPDEGCLRIMKKRGYLDPDKEVGYVVRPLSRAGCHSPSTLSMP